MPARRRAPTATPEAGTASATSTCCTSGSAAGSTCPIRTIAALLRSAPREVRHLLAAAVAEEDTARVLSTLGIGFTVWHDVRTDAAGPSAGLVRGRDDRGKLDHIVLGPTGLWAMLSEDWGEPVKTKRGELIGPALAPGERPVHELSVRARAFARAARVKFSALVVVVPDGASPEDVIDLGSIRVRRPCSCRGRGSSTW